MAKRLGPYGHNRIEELRQARGLSRDALGRAIGSSGSQVQKLELGERRLTLEWMQRIGRALDVDPAELLPHQPRGARDEAPPSISGSTIFVDGDPFIAVRTLKHANDFPPLASRKLYSAGFLRSITQAAPEQLLVMRARGDAMAPTIVDQDLLLIDCGAPLARAGLYAIRNGDEIEVRRLAIAPGSARIVVRADNPAYPGATEVDANAIEIVGRILQISHVTA